MFAPVWQRVVIGTYRSRPACLDGYHRHALADDTYPGMVAHAGSRVEGLVYLDVSDEDVARLDAFEGDEYVRRGVSLSLIGDRSAAALAADTYVFTAVQRLSAADWDPAAFALDDFLVSYCRDKTGG